MARYDSPALQAYLKQRKAEESGQRVCQECHQTFDAETPKVRWCPDCRLMLKATYEAEREVLLSKRQLARTKAKIEAEAEAEAELAAAGMVKCPRCNHTKDAYDGYSLCPDCRAYMRERKRKASGHGH